MSNNMFYLPNSFVNSTHKLNLLEKYVKPTYLIEIPHNGGKGFLRVMESRCMIVCMILYWVTLATTFKYTFNLNNYKY